MTQDIDRLLDQGTAAQARGDLDGAEALYRQALTLDGSHADALQLIGSLRLVRGDLDGAERFLSDAIKAAPDWAVSRINLAAVYLKRGAFEKALDQSRRALAAEPNNAFALKQAALAAERLSRFLDAAEALDALPRLRAATIDTDLKCAALFLAGGDLSRADQAVRRAAALRQKPDETHKVGALIAIARRAWTDLVTIARSWVEASPNNPDAHEMLARGLLEAGDIHAAQDAFKTVLDLSPALNAEQALTYGRLCLITQDFETAQTHLTHAAAALPHSSDAAFSMARLHTFKGNLTDAEAACEEALKRDPRSIRAYVQLTTLKRGAMPDAARAAMEHLWEKADGPIELVSSLGFALGDIAHKQTRYDDAFALYDKANGMNADLFARDGSVYDPTRSEARITRLIAMFEALETAPPDRSGTPQPIFIIGMPRSGTTLTESILAAHSRVTGAGEVLAGAKILEDFENQCAAAPGRPAADHLAANADLWRDAYRRALPDTNLAFVTDKLPINFLGLGVLAWLFPRARFIHITRDPLDTGLSIFRHAFPRAYDWSHRLADIGHFTAQYKRIMAFYEQRYADRITTIRYEALADAPDEQMRRIVGAAELDWEDGCASFYEDKRAIATFSAVQVRSPISKSSIGVHKPYADHLKPLAAALL